MNGRWRKVVSPNSVVRWSTDFWVSPRLLKHQQYLQHFHWHICYIYIYICLYLHHDYISLYMSSNLPYFFLACPPPQTPLLFSPRDETIRHPTDVNQTRPLGAHIHKTTELPEVLWGFFRLPWWTVTDPWIWKTQSKYVFNAVKFQLEGPVWKGFFKETREK